MEAFVHRGLTHGLRVKPIFKGLPVQKRVVKKRPGGSYSVWNVALGPFFGGPVTSFHIDERCITNVHPGKAVLWNGSGVTRSLVDRDESIIEMLDVSQTRSGRGKLIPSRSREKAILFLATRGVSWPPITRMPRQLEYVILGEGTQKTVGYYWVTSLKRDLFHPEYYEIFTFLYENGEVKITDYRHSLLCLDPHHPGHVDWDKIEEAYRQEGWPLGKK